MKMTAKAAMQALLDGKTLEGDDPWYMIKLDDEGNLVACDTKDGLEEDGFKTAYTLINHMDRVHEEYPLTFEEAIRVMLDGKVVVTSELHPYFRQRFHDGHFEYKEEDETEWMESYFPPCEQKGTKWRVVE